MTDLLTVEAAVEYRLERANDLFHEYVMALTVAQTSHDPDDWLKVGSIFKRYSHAAVAAERPRQPQSWG